MHLVQAMVLEDLMLDGGYSRLSLLATLYVLDAHTLSLVGEELAKLVLLPIPFLEGLQDRTHALALHQLHE